MGTPFLGEIKMISWNFPPQGWAFCNGQFLPINQNQPLFSLFGTRFGGNGQTTFALPDLRGRAPLHRGGAYQNGVAGGQEYHTLTLAEMPAHNHFVNVSTLTGDRSNPNFGGTGFLLAGDPGNAYSNNLSSNIGSLNPGTVSNVGGSQAHENRQPFLVLNFIVALIGAFPSQN